MHVKNPPNSVLFLLQKLLLITNQSQFFTRRLALWRQNLYTQQIVYEISTLQELSSLDLVMSAIVIAWRPSSSSSLTNLQKSSPLNEWIWIKLDVIVLQSILHKMTVWSFDLLKTWIDAVTKNRTQGSDSSFMDISQNPSGFIKF